MKDMFLINAIFFILLAGLAYFTDAYEVARFFGILGTIYVVGFGIIMEIKKAINEK